MAYSFDGEDPKVWHPTFPLVPEELQEPGESFMFGREPPVELFERIHGGDLIWAFNAAFERAVFEIICGPRLGWPVPRPEQYRCTMALAAAFALPLSLGGAAAALGLRQRKDDAGKKIMMKLTKPRKPTKKDSSLWHENINDLWECFEYCKQDVRAEAAVQKVLRPLSPLEQQVYLVDQQINARGVQIDLDFCRAAEKAANEREVKLLEETTALTGGEVTSFKQVAKCKAWLGTRGVFLEDMRKETVRDALAEDDHMDGSAEGPMEPDARRLLELRAAGGKSSVAKYGRMLRMACKDGRIRGGYQYHGATTGRWAARGAQFQNFPRGATEEEQELIISATKGFGLRLLEWLFEGPIDELSRALRGALVPAQGKKFVVSDYAAIEARGVFWLAGQEDLLELYRQGVDLYCWMAEKIFGVPMEEIRAAYKAGDVEATFMRFVGKQTTLGCGYGMGDPKFVLYCAQMGVIVPETLGRLAVKTYREAAPRVKDFWHSTQRAAVKAVNNPGLQVDNGKTKWKYVGRFLHCQLPSGRLLSYYKPVVKIQTVHRPERILEDGEVIPEKTWKAECLYYMAYRSGRFGYTKTFGGMLVENICQATTRDLMADCMVRLEGLGWNIVMHSHDELIVEADEDGPLDGRALEGLMESTPQWAEGLPVKAEAWEGKRYRK